MKVAAMQPTANRLCALAAFIMAMVLTLVLFSRSALGQQPQEIAPEQYWFYERLDMLHAVSETATEIKGVYFAKHTFIPFRVKRELVQDPVAKNQGYKEALRHLIAVMQNSGNAQMALEVHEKVRSLTAANVKMDEWGRWLTENREYLAWSGREGHFVIDEDAKRVGVPSAQYRQIHPWSTQP